MDKVIEAYSLEDLDNPESELYKYLENISKEYNDSQDIKEDEIRKFFELAKRIK